MVKVKVDNVLSRKEQVNTGELTKFHDIILFKYLLYKQLLFYLYLTNIVIKCNLYKKTRLSKSYLWLMCKIMLTVWIIFHLILCIGEHRLTEGSSLMVSTTLDCVDDTGCAVSIIQIRWCPIQAYSLIRKCRTV